MCGEGIVGGKENMARVERKGEEGKEVKVDGGKVRG